MRASEAHEIAINRYNDKVNLLLNQIEKAAKLGEFNTNVKWNTNTKQAVIDHLKDLGYTAESYFGDEGECYIEIYW